MSEVMYIEIPLNNYSREELFMLFGKIYNKLEVEINIKDYLNTEEEYEPVYYINGYIFDNNVRIDDTNTELEVILELYEIIMDYSSELWGDNIEDKIYKFIRRERLLDNTII